MPESYRLYLDQMLRVEVEKKKKGVRSLELTKYTEDGDESEKYKASLPAHAGKRQLMVPGGHLMAVTASSC